MKDLATWAGISKWLGTEHRARLWRRVVPALVSSSIELRGPLDLTALVLATSLVQSGAAGSSRLLGLATLGGVPTLEASGRNALCG